MKAILTLLLIGVSSLVWMAAEPRKENIGAAALAVGTTAPPFTLTSSDGRQVSLADFKGKTVVLEWFNIGCPFVKKHYQNGDMPKLQAEITGKGVVWLTINSTESGHRDYMDAAKSEQFRTSNNMMSSALLLDAEGTVGKAYGAKTTPHMFIVSADGALLYRGAIDDDATTDGTPSKATNHVRNAIGEILSGKPVSVKETDPYGCSVKYK